MTPSTPTKPLALITGASSGIGYELARLFAADGYDLIITSDTTKIETAADQLKADATEVTPVIADLRTEDGVIELFSTVKGIGRPLTAAALNAGIGHSQSFTDAQLDDLLSVVDLNVRSTVHLAKLILDDFVERDEGELLITSSIAATMPGPYQAVYNASKSFVQSFAEAVQSELSDTNVTVTALMPGPTETNFFHRAGLDNTLMGRSNKDDPAAVAEAGYRALKEGRRKIVADSLLSKTMAAVDSVLPDVAKAAAHRVLARPR